MTEVTPRSGKRRWSILGRVALFWTGYIVIIVLTALAANVTAIVPERWGQLTWGLASGAAILLLTLLFLRREGRSVGAVGLNLETTSVLRLISGVSIGLAIYGLNILLVTVTAGPIRFAPTASADPSALVLVVCTYLGLSSMEELGFRGYPLRSLVPAFGLWPAQVIVAVAFGLSHLPFGWSATAILLGVVPSGLLYGMAAIASRGLAMPIGVHAGWNLASWSIGEKKALGIWTMTVEEQASARIATVAPIIGVAVVVLTAVAFWRWHQSHRNRDDEAGA
jgi:uncharacterized protein